MCITALGLGSCGGGGVSSDTGLNTGTLSLLPAAANMYAMVPFTLTIAGGNRPYTITSSEQTVIALAGQRVDGNSLTIVPNNPGVVDPTTDENEVPSRTLTLTVRDNRGTTTTAEYKVLQNFLTGYGLSIATIGQCTGAIAGATAPQSCVGLDSLINIVPTSAGLLQANRQLRLTRRYGNFSFVNNVDNTLLEAQTVTTDSTGRTTLRLRPSANILTQLAGFRLTDVLSGMYRDVDFVIVNSLSNAQLTIVPSSITLGGALSNQCGVGAVDIFVFGGVPPYTAATSWPQAIQVSPASVANSGESFRVSLFNQNFCLNPGNVVFQDSAGNRAELSVTTEVGTGTPILPLVIAPATLCVADGSSGTIVINGGNNNKVLNTSNAGLATVAPATGAASFTATVTAVGVGGAAPGTNVVISVSDGTSQVQMTVRRQTTCP